MNDSSQTISQHTESQVEELKVSEATKLKAVPAAPKINKKQ